MEKSVSLHTLGCRLNFSETGSLAKEFSERGYKINSFGEKSDVVFINTCTVTDQADSTCRNLIRKAQKSSPEATIVVAGCYAQMDPNAIAKMKGVDLILGTQEKYKVFEYLESETREQIHIDKTNEFWGGASSLEEGHTRAFLKIQDGCNYVCSFCIIPFARGPSRTITIAKAKSQANELAKQGYKEIVITGVNIGEYEKSSGESLSHLIETISGPREIERLRLSSIEPNTVTEELLISLKNNPKFLDHFHIPLQSGSDNVLKEMKRKYDRNFYEKILFKIKEYFPNAAIGCDIMAGFPGESSEDFHATYTLLEKLPITHFHVFPYSKRKQTLAAKRDDHIPAQIKKERVKKLIELGDKKLCDFMLSQMGKKSKVLFEKQTKDKFWLGHTENFLKVKVRSNENLKNKIKEVLLKDLNNKILLGDI